MQIISLLFALFCCLLLRLRKQLHALFAVQLSVKIPEWSVALHLCLVGFLVLEEGATGVAPV